MQVLLAGYGFLGAAIAQLLRKNGHTVTAIRRRENLPEEQIDFIAADLSVGPPWPGQRHFGAVIFCLAPDSREARLYEETYVRAQRHLLSAVTTERYVFISSTAVYPESAGYYPEEDAAPVSERAALLLQAEKVAHSLPHTTTLRLAGLYNSERRIYYGMPATVGSDRLVHFIHRDDAARAVLYAIEQNLVGVFNVHDGCPLWRSEILKRLGYLHHDLPPGPERRIAVERWQRTGFRPVYADYFAGIQAGLSGENR